MSYIYIKKDKSASKKNKKKHLILFFVLSGLSLFLFVAIPIIKFQLTSSLNFKQLLNPLSTRGYNNQSSILSKATSDYTQLSNWFNDPSNQLSNQLSINDNGNKYYLSIPELGIKDSTVIIGSMDLEESLIQYPQTALPGQLGNSVVFGHSVLPQFFNPKSYLTIFSTLHKLEIGDEILIDYDGSNYKYLVTEMYEVKADDFSVLEQRFDNKRITLITCSPPGTYLRRLVVKAEIAI